MFPVCEVTDSFVCRRHFSEKCWIVFQRAWPRAHEKGTEQEIF